MVNADSMNVCTELLATTLDRSTLHGKRPEAAKRKALGMGISPRALGESATARAERGTWRARTGTSRATSLVVAVGERWPGSRVGVTSVSQGHRMLEVEGGVNGAWRRRAMACCCACRSRGRKGCCCYLEQDKGSGVLGFWAAAVVVWQDGRSGGRPGLKRRAPGISAARPGVIPA